MYGLNSKKKHLNWRIRQDKRWEYVKNGLRFNLIEKRAKYFGLYPGFISFSPVLTDACPFKNAFAVMRVCLLSTAKIVKMAQRFEKTPFSPDLGEKHPVQFSSTMRIPRSFDAVRWKMGQNRLVPSRY